MDIKLVCIVHVMMISNVKGTIPSAYKHNQYVLLYWAN